MRRMWGECGVGESRPYNAVVLYRERLLIERSKIKKELDSPGARRRRPGPRHRHYQNQLPNSTYAAPGPPRYEQCAFCRPKSRLTGVQTSKLPSS